MIMRAWRNGSRTGLKIQSRKACEFESHCSHHNLTKWAGSLEAKSSVLIMR